MSSPYLGLIEYSVESRGYVERIESNFQWSSSLLLELLMKEMHLMTRLRSCCCGVCCCDVCWGVVVMYGVVVDRKGGK